MDLIEKAAKAVELLEMEYPDAICALQYSKDYELLFATRLSAQCTDVRVNLVTKDLFRELPTLQSFAEAPLEQIEQLIKTCGLYHTKAKDLKNCAIMLLEKYDGKVPDNMEDLLKLPGIGRGHRKHCSRRGRADESAAVLTGGASAKIRVRHAMPVSGRAECPGNSGCAENQ